MKKKGERTVQITVSVPLSIASAIDHEADLMGRSYSEASVVLLRIGLDIRRTSRIPEVPKI